MNANRIYWAAIALIGAWILFAKASEKPEPPVDWAAKLLACQQRAVRFCQPYADDRMHFECMWNEAVNCNRLYDRNR